MLALVEAQSTVERMTEGRAPFGRVEDYIDTAPLTAEQKSALWLLAWTGQDRRTQRRVAIEALAAAA